MHSIFNKRSIREYSILLVLSLSLIGCVTVPGVSKNTIWWGKAGENPSNIGEVMDLCRYNDWVIMTKQRFLGDN